jgi:hypothetical protein
MAQSNEHEVCLQFTRTRLSEFTLKSEQFVNELNVQYQSCPTTFLPLKTTLDKNLQEFVQVQQQFLSHKMKYQLMRYQDMIHEKELFQTLSTHHMTNDQVKIIFKLDYVHLFVFSLSLFV